MFRKASLVGILFLVAVVAAQAAILLQDGKHYTFTGFLKLRPIEGGVQVLLTQNAPPGSCGIQDIPLNGSGHVAKETLVFDALHYGDVRFEVAGVYHAVYAQILGAYAGLTVDRIKVACDGGIPLKFTGALRKLMQEVPAGTMLPVIVTIQAPPFIPNPPAALYDHEMKTLVWYLKALQAEGETIVIGNVTAHRFINLEAKPATLLKVANHGAVGRIEHNLVVVPQ